MNETTDYSDNTQNSYFSDFRIIYYLKTMHIIRYIIIVVY